jgi:cytochrome c
LSQGNEEAGVNADVSYGEYLSGECMACHHKQGSDQGIPSISGLDQEAFIYLMQAYRDKELENPIMQMVAGRLDDEQIASLALYFSNIPAGN